ncbi:MAG: phosphopentomutase [Ruminococcaceae bacterium]|mgnify:CR=1 FL=1|nr:phosphopentomutase [Oscillospiraceae bacterium]
MSKRVFLIVLDSFGVGELPDAKFFGDVSANTLKALSTSEFFEADTLSKLGLFNIDGVDYLPSFSSPLASFGKCAAKSMGKDTMTGHWEICGVEMEKPMPVYPNGFPAEVMDEFAKRTGRGWLVNKPYSGTAVIEKHGDEHVNTGKLIVYTSADSVFQIAAHEDIVPIEKLYEYCEIARELLQGEHAVGRVIARPFVGTSGNYTRTARRHDYSLVPPKTALNFLAEKGYNVISIGKINDIFASSGITESHPTTCNADGMHELDLAVNRDFSGLVFANLVDFDMLFGHRRDVDAYAKGIAKFDTWLSKFISKLGNDDVLVITADHGCDPSFEKHTDHTREYIPLLWYTRGGPAVNLGIRESFADIGKTILDYFGVESDIRGVSFLQDVTFTPDPLARFRKPLL